MSESTIPRHWDCWISENLMMNVAPDTMVERLVANGIDEGTARSAIASMAEHPSVKVGRSITSRLKKTEMLLSMVQQLAQAIPQDVVDERSGIDPSTFFADYYSRNRPLVLRKAIRHWPALYKWSPQHFADRYGNAPVMITSNRQADPWYEINARTHMTQTTMADFVSMLLVGGQTNDYYLVANNYALQSERLAPLFDDIGGVSGLLDSTLRRGRTFLWLGPAGTVTPLHHDKTNLLIAQVLGRKRIILYPTESIRHMNNVVGVFTAADPEHPERSPIDLRGIRHFVVTIDPGDVLFVPIAWWHHVRALDLSITVSMDNFIFHNSFTLVDPCNY
ncbi:cupin-like domain-containing protein [Mesorhizobium sp. M0408]|uniref:cupin-like domain-containing protein n=1 Tax=Mesorhizobium sp. M0408 TaxID=2956942 RepID=UPI003335D7E0